MYLQWMYFTDNGTSLYKLDSVIPQLYSGYTKYMMMLRDFIPELVCFHFILVYYVLLFISCFYQYWWGFCNYLKSARKVTGVLEMSFSLHATASWREDRPWIRTKVCHVFCISTTSNTLTGDSNIIEHDTLCDVHLWGRLGITEGVVQCHTQLFMLK